MGIITDANINSTGLQIIAWRNEILEHLAAVDLLKSQLKAQLQNVRNNTKDFSDEDRAEMEQLVSELISDIKNRE